MSTAGWLGRPTAERIAHEMLKVFGPDFESAHVWGTGTGGRVQVTVFLRPLTSSDVPAPETFVFSTADLVPAHIAEETAHATELRPVEPQRRPLPKEFRDD